MITATEAKAMVKEFEAKKEAEAETKVEAFIEKEVSPAIAEMAQKGVNKIELNLPVNLSNKHFEKVLTENGYTILHIETSPFYAIHW